MDYFSKSDIPVSSKYRKEPYWRPFPNLSEAFMLYSYILIN